MRIGIDARFYGSLGKGLGRYTEKLIQELSRLPGDDEFVIFLRRENFDECLIEHPRFTKVLADFPWYGWREQILFPRLLRQHQLDLVHFPHFNVPLFYRWPFLVTIHDLILLHYPTIKASELPPFLYWIKYGLYRLVIGSAVRRAHSILTVSQFTAADIATAYPAVAGKISMAYEAADAMCPWVSEREVMDCLQSHGLVMPDGLVRSYVLYVGNAYPHKNLELLLDMAARLPRKLFVCVGKEDYFYRRLRHLAEERHLNNVCFVGFVPDRVVSVLYRKAESYFFPSLYEGFGLPALEAFQLSVPVVAARAGALPEICAEAALFFDPMQPAEAKQALERVGTDPVLRQALIERGYRRGAEFSWISLARQTLREYHKAIPYERYSPSSATPNS